SADTAQRVHGARLSLQAHDKHPFFSNGRLGKMLAGSPVHPPAKGKPHENRTRFDVPVVHPLRPAGTGRADDLDDNACPDGGYGTGGTRRQHVAALRLMKPAAAITRHPPTRPAATNDTPGQNTG